MEPNPSFLDHPYLKEQIIAYIGNKRRLLGLIDTAVSRACPDAGKGLSFLDAFSGSGIVSRYARLKGFDLHANDWEYYSYVINHAFLSHSENDISALFGGADKRDALFDHLNSIPDPEPEEEYIACYYAPRSCHIEEVDHTRERLFYTRDNALKIDRIRNRIENLYPEKKSSEHLFLVALLLYQAATHTNTSGVFKACHKGFGGHGKDALKRILQPITLQMPPLVESEGEVRLYQDDINTLIRSGITGHLDIAYLDPPYNQHQYGSNYHMLNTIALWDRIPEPLKQDASGALMRKAAIREDWVKTRSDYCYRNSAAGNFKELIDHLDADHILISYSTDGIIPFEEMKRICQARGRLSLVSNEYTRFRGGKQTNKGVISNIEFIFSIDTKGKTSKADNERIELVLTRRKVYLLMKSVLSLKKLEDSPMVQMTKGSTLLIELNGVNIKLPTENKFRISTPPSLEELSQENLFLLYHYLESLICHSKEEELQDAFLRIESGEGRLYQIKRLPELLKRLAYKKTRQKFEHFRKQISRLQIQYPDDFSLIEKKMETLDEIAVKRFAL